MNPVNPVDKEAAAANASRICDRPRERLLCAGAAQVGTVELLALCLGPGNSGCDSVSTAQRLLATYGSIDQLLAAPVEALLMETGLGPAKVARLKAMWELAMRQTEEGARDKALFTDAATVARYLQRRIGYRSREVFGCLFLDARHYFMAWEELFMGSINRTHVHAREVLRRGLQLNAAAVVLGHNHPSGVAEPSHADLQLTAELKDLLARVDIRLLDHVVVARGVSVSMATRGLLPG